MRRSERSEKSTANSVDIACYMKTNYAGSWIVLALTLIIVVCGAVWMATGTIKTTMSVTGVKDGGTLTFYVSPEKAIQMGLSASNVSGQTIELDGKEIGQMSGYVSTVSKEQILTEYDNLYITQQLELSESNIILNGDLSPDACADGVVTVDVVTAETTPIKLLLS